jgi:HSP20 family protein
MALIRWDPLRAFRQRDGFLEDFLHDIMPHAEGEFLQPPAEVAEANDSVTVKMLIPGVDKDHVKVTVDDGVLTVRGEFEEEKKEERKDFYRQEIRYGAFRRAVPLPVEVDGDKAEARLRDGMLMVTIPKCTESAARTIPIEVA